MKNPRSSEPGVLLCQGIPVARWARDALLVLICVVVLTLFVVVTTLVVADRVLDVLQDLAEG